MNINVKRNNRDLLLEELKRFDAKRVFLALDTYETDKNKKELTIYMTYSEDGGKTWSKPTPTGICGTPPHLLLLRDGNLLLSYGRREIPRGSRARISTDGGKTFGEEYILSESDSYDIGYPSTVELNDGTLFTVHYQAWKSDDKTSILYTKWRR